jgi:hypothetical protein
MGRMKPKHTGSNFAGEDWALCRCSVASGLWRAVLLVNPFTAPCRAQRQRPFRARSTLRIFTVADHDHLRRVASAFSHGGHVLVLLPVQAFSALSVKWSGYEGFHRGFSLGTGAKSGTIKAAQSGLDVKSAGSPAAIEVFTTMAMRPARRAAPSLQELWISSCIVGNSPEKSCQLFPRFGQFRRKLPLAVPNVWLLLPCRFIPQVPKAAAK